MKHILHLRSVLLLSITGLLLGFYSPARAQYDIGYSHYMFNEFFINPAYAGGKDAFSAMAMVRDQWSGFKGAPRTILLSAHTPVAKDKVGLGIGVSYDQIGVNQQTSGCFDFAYRIHLKRGIWALGLQASLGSQNHNFASLKYLPDDYTTDPSLMNTGASFFMNAGVGTYYYTENFHIGFSIPRLFNNFYELGGNKRLDIADWTYYLQSGYVFHLGDNFQLMPSAMLKLTYAVRPQINVSALSLLWNTLWLGADYRTDNSLAALAGVQLSRYLRVTYSYDINLGSYTRQALGGSHEVSLSYTMDFMNKRVMSPRLF